MPNPTDTPTAKKPAKQPIEKPAEAEPKPRPVKRPSKPAYHVPRGIAWTDPDNPDVTIRVKGGTDVEDGIIPADLVTEYLERGDIAAITTH